MNHTQHRPGKPAILARSEARDGLDAVSWDELRRQVAAMAAGLRRMGVVEGDRVVAYLPNIPETIVAFLACASIGAIWSMCSPDMGTHSALDRVHQIAPKVLLAVDGYRYGGKVVANPSGGLLSKAHPLGATGLAQCNELVEQPRGTADARQVQPARLQARRPCT